MKTESTKVHPFVEALDNMYTAYGGQWPPRGSFENWPESFTAFQEIADEMPEKMNKFNNVQKFRNWLSQELENKVNLDQVMEDVEKHLRHDDAILLGFAAPLSFLANAYRWGTVPTTEEERARTHLQFPHKLWTPFEKINDFYGLVQRGNTFTLNVGNCIYEDDTPLDMRFCFNFDPKMIKTEKNFFLSFLHMEKTWKPAMQMMADYLTLTENARESRDEAEALLEERVQLLKDIRKALVAVSRVFHNYMKDTMVSVDLWADYVQCMPAWNINGVEGGASGGESMTFHSLDEFLGTLGEGVIYKGGMRKRMGTPLLYRECMNALSDESRSYRFNSFLDLPEESDPLTKAKDDLISMLYTWRLHHTKVAPRYLENSRMTSGGSVDVVKKKQETLAERGERELRERARETADFLSMDRKPKSMRQQTAIEIPAKKHYLDFITSKSMETIGCVVHKLFSWFW